MLLKQSRDAPARASAPQLIELVEQALFRQVYQQVQVIRHYHVCHQRPAALRECRLYVVAHQLPDIVPGKQRQPVGYRAGDVVVARPDVDVLPLRGHALCLDSPTAFSSPQAASVRFGISGAD